MLPKSHVLPKPSFCADPPTEIDPSLRTNPSALPGYLVGAARCLEPFLPVSCKWLEEDNLKVIGSRPIDGSGFADAWIGERVDYQPVAYGGFSDVWKGEGSGTGSCFALKVLHIPRDDYQRVKVSY